MADHFHLGTTVTNNESQNADSDSQGFTCNLPKEPMPSTCGFKLQWVVRGEASCGYLLVFCKRWALPQNLY